MKNTLNALGLVELTETAATQVNGGSTKGKAVHTYGISILKGQHDTQSTNIGKI
jgi:hypothetical protein